MRCRPSKPFVTYTPDGVKTYDTVEPPSEVLDTTRFVVSYRMLYQQRPENEHPMEDLLLLEVGRNMTKFYSYKTWQTDSLVRATPPEQVMANLGSFHGGVQDVLFRDQSAGRLTHTDQIGMDHLLLYRSRCPTAAGNLPTASGRSSAMCAAGRILLSAAAATRRGTPPRSP